MIIIMRACLPRAEVHFASLHSAAGRKEDGSDCKDFRANLHSRRRGETHDSKKLRLLNQTWEWRSPESVLLLPLWGFELVPEANGIER